MLLNLEYINRNKTFFKCKQVYSYLIISIIIVFKRLQTITNDSKCLATDYSLEAVIDLQCQVNEA